MLFAGSSRLLVQRTPGGRFAKANLTETIHL
jgi:hypothetical protein